MTIITNKQREAARRRWEQREMSPEVAEELAKFVELSDEERRDFGEHVSEAAEQLVLLADVYGKPVPFGLFGTEAMHFLVDRLLEKQPLARAIIDLGASDIPLPPELRSYISELLERFVSPIRRTVVAGKGGGSRLHMPKN
jgi:hypothetical protein